MKLLICIVSLTLAQTLKADDEKPNLLKVEGQFSVTAPEGFKWQKLGEPKADGPASFVATKEGAPSRIVIGVERASADTDAKRLARIKGLYNGIVTSLKKQQMTDLKATPPQVKPPIAERVEFSFTGKTAEGHGFVLRAVLMFQKNTYHIQLADASEEAVAALAKSLDSLKE